MSTTLTWKYTKQLFLMKEVSIFSDSWCCSSTKNAVTLHLRQLYNSAGFSLTNAPAPQQQTCWKAYGRGGEQCGGGINNAFQISTAAACDLILFSPVIWIQCFSRPRHPGVKYLAKRLTGTKPFFSPHPPAPSLAPYNLFISARKTGNLSNCLPDSKNPDTCRQIDTDQNKQSPRWVLRVRLTVVSFLSFQRVMKLFSLSICCTRSSLTCWKHHRIRGS